MDLPGGFVDFNETLEGALQREIKEELNIIISKMRYVCSFPTDYHFKGLYYQPLDSVFHCSVADWEGMQPADDVTEICFYSPDRVNPDEIGFVSHRRIIKQLSENSQING